MKKHIYSQGKAAGLLSFLLLFALTVSAGPSRFRLVQEDERLLLELSESLLDRDFFLVNQAVSTQRGVAMLPGSVSGTPYILRFMRGEAGKIILVKPEFSKVMTSSDTSVFQWHAPGKSLDTLAVVSCEWENQMCRMDITDWAKKKKGIAEYDCMELPQKVISHPDRQEWISWRKISHEVVQISSCLILLPEKPIRPRKPDPRVGYFNAEHNVYRNDTAKGEKREFIARWRLEPRPQDMKKSRRGVLVTPQTPILFYLDPLTPSKWVPYIKKAINNWQPAFERAGFKQAVVAMEAPKDDPSWTLASCRAAIVYKPTSEENAFGNTYRDPRTGEILHARIQWGHNLVEWLKGNYLIQSGPGDPKALNGDMPDELLGSLIECIITHEVGHILGLTHNFTASTVTPVEKLRDNAWLSVHGHTPSIMDYSRFNYVAQPEDGIESRNMLPRIGVYDYWAIEWGYRRFPQLSAAEEEKHVYDWLTETLKQHPEYIYISELEPMESRTQSEDLGDDQVIADTYGINNLKRVMERMQQWPPDANGRYDRLQQFHRRLLSFSEKNVPLGQYYFYIQHMLGIIGGMHYHYIPGGQWPDKENAPREQQKRAMAFLEEHLFHPPFWLLKPMQEGKVEGDPLESIQSLYKAAMTLLFSKVLGSNQARSGEEAYVPKEMLADLERIVWQSLYEGKLPDLYQQNLQQIFISQLKSSCTRCSPADGQKLKDFLQGIKQKVAAACQDHPNEAYRRYCQSVLRLIK